MINAVIFDLDGTLLDTEPDFTQILNQLLHNNGKQAVSGQVVRRIASFGAKAIVHKGFELKETDPQLPPLLEEFLALYAAKIPNTQASLFDDVDQLISSIHAEGIPWAIMTNKARRFSEPLLKHFETFSTCSALCCPDDVGASKPDPAGLLSICENLNITPESAVYVGDHPRDIEAAKNAGMSSIAVRWGYLPDNNPVESWGANFIAETPINITQFLKL